MKIVADKDNCWGFSAWVINLNPWNFLSVVWTVDWHQMGLGVRWNASGIVFLTFVEFFLLPVRLTITYRDCRKDQMSEWYGWVNGDPYPEEV